MVIGAGKSRLGSIAYGDYRAMGKVETGKPLLQNID